MEDFHGYNRFEDPRRALDAYYKAFGDDLPPGAEFHYSLGMGMLSYYLTWYERRNQLPQFTTVWLDAGKKQVPAYTPGATPAVEQRFFIPLGIEVWTNKEGEVVQINKADGTVEYPDPSKLNLKTNEYTKIPIFYHGTLDRIVEDRNGNWWIMDYKTAKSADTNKLDTDDQIAAYLWAASIWFNRPIRGMVYLQMTKDLAKEPKRLKDGSISVDKRQKTTYSLLKSELIWEFGSVDKAPNKYIEFLNHLAMQETEEGDRFIRWDMVKRSQAQIETTYDNILAETYEMLTTPYFYPNPTRDCIWDCPARDMCLMQDRKEWNDIEALITLEWEQRPRDEDGNIEEWRENLEWPVPELNGTDLVPIDTLMDKAATQMLEIDSQTFQEEVGFVFMFEKE
jgi:hypothetical protein